MKKILKISMLTMAVLCGMSVGAQTVKINGVYENNRYDDHADHFYSKYVGYNYDLQKSIFIVENSLYSMEWNGSSLTTPVKNPAVNMADFYVNGQFTDNDKALWANNFNLMVGNSGAAYVDGTITTVYSRDESSTTDEELFAVRKWDAKTGNLLSNEIRPKSDHLESAGIAFNPVDGKVYGLFYLTGQQLSEEITSDPEYFVDQDADMTDGDAGYAICTIDMKTMKVTPVTPGLYYYNFVTFAINAEGRAFALTSGGSNGYIGEDGRQYNIDNKLTGAQLCEFDLTTGLMKQNAEQVLDESTGEFYTEYTFPVGATGYSSQYRRQSACFAKSNPNKMYWNGYYNSGKGINDYGSWSSLSDKEWKTNGKYDTCLYEVDITTGKATRLAKIDNRFTFSCMWVDGDDCSDGAYKEETGIEAVASSQDATAVYNLSGQKVNASQKGIQIVKQGNKVIKVMR